MTSNRGFFVANVGDAGASRKVILTSDRRTFCAVEGAKCVMEGGMQDALRRWVIAGSLQLSAGLDENRISRLRAGLGLPDGRTKEAETQRLATAPDDIPLNQVRFVGSGISAILVVSRMATVWIVVPETQIIYESRLREPLKRWLQQTEVVTVASELDVSPARVVTMSKYFGVARKR